MRKETPLLPPSEPLIAGMDWGSGDAKTVVMLRLPDGRMVDFEAAKAVAEIDWKALWERYKGMGRQ